MKPQKKAHDNKLHTHKPFRLSHYSLSSLFVISFAIGALVSLIFRLINFKGVNSPVVLPQSTPINGSSYLQMSRKFDADEIIFTSHPKNGTLWIDHELLMRISKGTASKMISQTEDLLLHLARDAFIKEKMQRVFRSKSFIVVIVKDKARSQKTSVVFDPKSNTLSIFDSAFISRDSILRLKTDLYRIVHQINIFRCRKDGSLFPFFNAKDSLALATAISLCDARRITTWDGLRAKKISGSMNPLESQQLNNLTKILENYIPKLIPVVLTGSEKEIAKILHELEHNKVTEINHLYLTEAIRYKEGLMAWGTHYPRDHAAKNESNAMASIYDTMWRRANFGNILREVAKENSLQPDEFILREHDADIHMEPEYTDALCGEVRDYHRMKFGSCK